MSIFEPWKALEYCEKQATSLDIGVSLHGKFIPNELKQFFYTVHALRLELLKAQETVTNPTLKASKLAWWLSNLNDIWELRPPREPLSIALCELRKYSTVRRSHFERMIRGRLQDQEIKTWQHFDRFIDNNYTMNFYILLELFGLFGETEFTAATFAGRAWGISDLLLLSKHYTVNGRFYFPEDLLTKYKLPIGVAIDDQDQKEKIPEEFFDVILEVASYGKQNMDKAREMMPNLQKHTNIAFLPLSQCEYFYQHLEQNNFDIFKMSNNSLPWTRILLSMIRHMKAGTF